MKKVLLLYGLLVLVLLVLYLVKSGGMSSLFKKPATVEVDGKTFSLELADTEKERMIGLTKKSSLGSSQGMLFIFPKKGRYSFWTKSMKFPIDIIYVNDDTIVDTFKNVPAAKSDNIPIINSSKEVNYVIELSAGSIEKNGIKIGDKLHFQNL